MKFLIMNNVYIIFLSLCIYNYLFQGFTFFVVRIRNFKYVSERKILNLTDVLLTCFATSLFLNTSK
jgi:hypothetical protein